MSKTRYNALIPPVYLDNLLDKELEISSRGGHDVSSVPSLSQASYIELSIYNVKGELIKRLVSGVEKAGAYKVVWNGRDERGRSVASGVYFCILRSSDGNKITRKIILLR